MLALSRIAGTHAFEVAQSKKTLDTVSDHGLAGVVRARGVHDVGVGCGERVDTAEWWLKSPAVTPETLAVALGI